MLILLWFQLKNIEKEMKVNHNDEDPKYFDHYDAEALHEILDTQHKITEYTKQNNFKTFFQILKIIDYFADDPSFTRQSKMLHSLCQGKAQHDQHYNRDSTIQRHKPHHQGQRHRAICL